MSAMIKTSIFLILCVIVSSSSNLKSKLFNVDRNQFKEAGVCNARACLAAEKGGIIPNISKQYEATASNIRVFRIFTDPAVKGKASKYGSWWSLTNPTGRKTEYMRNNAICTEWNDMTHLVVCELKRGVKVSVGPTQSSKCGNGSVIPQNPRVMQVYIESAYGKDDRTIVGTDGPFTRCHTVVKSPLI
jgi:hypothetical protein